MFSKCKESIYTGRRKTIGVQPLSYTQQLRLAASSVNSTAKRKVVFWFQIHKYQIYYIFTMSSDSVFLAVLALLLLGYCTTQGEKGNRRFVIMLTKS